MSYFTGIFIIATDTATFLSSYCWHQLEIWYDNWACLPVCVTTKSILQIFWFWLKMRSKMNVLDLHFTYTSYLWYGAFNAQVLLSLHESTSILPFFIKKQKNHGGINRVSKRKPWLGLFAIRQFSETSWIILRTHLYKCVLFRRDIKMCRRSRLKRISFLFALVYVLWTTVTTRTNFAHLLHKHSCGQNCLH